VAFLAPQSSVLTDEQYRAVVCRDASVVLSSGAGCGKTHVLTERYLSHLREEADVGNLVAITFTDRAARQMRERIRRAVLQELHAAPVEEAGHWEAHLRGLETAQITTIHSFCGTLLRQHAVEAGLDPGFDVVEDVLAASLEAEALTECLQALLPAQTDLGADLRELVLLFGWPPTVDAVRSLLHQRDASLWSHWLGQAPEEIAARWQAERLALLPAYVAHLVKTSPKIAHCLTLLRQLECIGPLMRANVAYILRETPNVAGAANPAEAVEALTEAAKVGKERGKAWRSEADYQAIMEAFEGFREEMRERLGQFVQEAEDAPLAAVTGQRFLRVAEAAAQAYQQRKQRLGVVDFQDLLTLARDLLRDHEEVREQVQRRYRFLLIDELQDTDPVQMELVTYLCGGGLTAGKLFAVGDHKQSIYRFRNADVSLFLDLRRQVPPEGRLDLTRNFRSQPAILDFTNALLGTRIQDYTPLAPHHAQVTPGPCVEFLWTPGEASEPVTDLRSREADAIARRINQMVAGEALVRDDQAGLRPVQYRDIVLLFRAMSNVHLYENALRNQGIDYYLVGGRAFFAQQEIYDLLNLLRALENPQDAVSLAGTLRSPFCCLSDEALFLLGCHRDGMWAGLHDAATMNRLPEDQQPAAERASRFLERWRSLKDRLPIARLLGMIFADSGYDAAMQFEFLGDRKLANLWKLLDMARTFDRSALFGLADFIQRLGDLVKAQPREEQAATQPEESDVVRLMTIHQAKGLEFPIVFVPDCTGRSGGGYHPAAMWDARLGCVVRPPTDEDPPPFSDVGWQLWKANEWMADYHEELRTLYVACTRAEDYLVLSGSLAEPFRPMNTWMLTLTERFDLASGVCQDESIAIEHRPQVRVTEPESLPSSGERSERTRTEAEVRTEDPARIASIPLRLTPRDIVPLSELEEYLQASGGRKPPVDATLSGTAASTGGLRPPPACSLAHQFATEDDADRSKWLRPCERVPGLLVSRREQQLRDVLERWDFHDPESWRALLPEHADAELEAILNRFAASNLFQQLAAAQACHRDLEFLLDATADADALPRIWGVIDCLWQDSANDWHVLAWTTAPLEETWSLRRAGLIVQAWSIQQRLGVWPKQVTLYSFAEGQALSSTQRQFGQRALIAEVRTLLTGLLRQPLAD
jgi:ATP-dependent helicase/nuclease subunit A